MSTPGSIVQAQAEALLRRVAREQESQCRRTRDAAAEQARGIVARAWEEARARLRSAADEERRAYDRALADRRAALETVGRQKEQAVMRELMDEAWRELPDALRSVWQDAGGRREWCAAACQVALDSLDCGRGLRVEVDADAPQDVEHALRSALGGLQGVAIEWVRVPALGAGLRMHAGRACVDATVAGLLSSSERIESELLAEVERLAEQRAGQTRDT